MRKLIVTNIVSLDGFITGPGGDVMAMPMDHAFDESNVEHMRTATTILLGATSYRGFVGFWPSALEMPGITEASAEIARLWPAMEKVTVSDSLTEDETGPWRETTTIVPRSAAHATVAALKEGDGGDILMFGSSVLWNDLLAAGLVDELHLMVGPVVVGDGTPAFRGGVTATALRLTDVRRWDGSDNVLLSYAV
ncbi:MAG: dihydrofolate reductase family protein [Actinomycetota bacterium]|nr:dihydrofolate reductase family protein [Actinomycetota bacterium]